MVNDEPMEYSGDASRILKLKFPINVSVASRLFAAISIDGSLPNRRRKRREIVVIDAVNDAEGVIIDNVDDIDDGVDLE